MARAERREVATYHYVTRQGEPIRRKIRFEPKGFAWECYTESGWSAGYGSELDVLYRLPEVVAGVAEGLDVTLLEGEKDADRLVAEGFGPATTAPQNGKWPAGLARPLAGANVMIIWDRDVDGSRRAHWAMEALREVGATYECWRAARGKDISDHLDNGLGWSDLVREDPPPVPEQAEDGYKEREAVEAVLSGAGEFREQLEEMLEMYAGGEPRIEWLSMDDILSQPPPRWQVEAWIPEVGYTVLYGGQGVGKTILASDLADSIMRGHDWNGYRVDKGAVMMLEGEGTQQLGPVFAALLRSRGDLNGAAPAYVTQATWDITSPAGLARLALEVLRRSGVRVLIVDSAGLYGTVNKDGVEDTRNFALGMRSLALTLDITVIVLQHTNASGQARGTLHLQMFSEAVLKLEALGSREAGLFHVDKNRYGPLKAMRMEKVSLGTSMVWDCTRGAAGDEYLPEDFIKDKAASREEGKAWATEQREAAAREDPERVEAVWEAVPSGYDNRKPTRGVKADVHGVRATLVAPILDGLEVDGRIKSEVKGMGKYWWRP